MKAWGLAVAKEDGSHSNNRDIRIWKDQVYIIEYVENNTDYYRQYDYRFKLAGSFAFFGRKWRSDRFHYAFITEEEYSELSGFLGEQADGYEYRLSGYRHHGAHHNRCTRNVHCDHAVLYVGLSHLHERHPHPAPKVDL